jgi:hypothetical protein
MRRAGGIGCPCQDADSTRKESSMLDVLMVALALGFFALSVGYAYVCDGM